MPLALITGVTGQDGSYLSDFLIEKGYHVVGIKRRSSNLEAASRVDHLHGHPRFKMRYGDVCDGSSMTRLLHEYEPDEVYNLAAQSHVGVSFELPEYTADATGMGALRLLEGIRTMQRPARFYQASTSEMFGNEPAPQDEIDPFRPVSPYGAAKVFAHNTTVAYRDAYGLYASCGILFNHESPRRGETFVTRKVCRAAARIEAGRQTGLELGNLDAKRDWGHAKDYVRAMWLMLQQDTPRDYVIATGRAHSVRDLCRVAFDCVNLDWRDYVVLREQHNRPVDIDCLCGDASLARSVLGWEPSVTFEELIAEMVDAERAAL